MNVLASTQDDDREGDDLDTLDTPSANWFRRFFRGVLRSRMSPIHFTTEAPCVQCVTRPLTAQAGSALISRYRLLEARRYFLHADRDWTQRNLIDPLLRDDDESIALWPAAARGPLFTDTLQIIGNAMAERAVDRRLGRETRTRLVFSLVVESLHAFRESREPAVSNLRVQQVLRSLDEGVRAPRRMPSSSLCMNFRRTRRKTIRDRPGPGYSVQRLHHSSPRSGLRSVLWLRRASAVLSRICPQHREKHSPKP